MIPFYTIISPSLQRDSLFRCCESLNKQNFKSWHHIVYVDGSDAKPELLDRCRHTNRIIFIGGERHGHYGNRCRHLAWQMANSTWTWYLDDDNFVASPTTLSEIALLLEPLSYETKFALFPIHRHGRVFFNDPPGLCMTDTMNVLARTEVSRWPDIEAREADGHWVEELKAKYQYAAFPEASPIGIMEYSSNGV